MRSTRGLLAVLALAGVLATTACSGSGDDPRPSSRETVTSGGLARASILPEDQLPEGWRYATEEQFLGKPEMCGVVLEPPSLTGATTQRFTNVKGSDRFVIQYSFESDDEAATAKRIDEFATAAPACTSFSPGDGLTLKVEPITDITAVGQSFGAVRATHPEEPLNRRDYVVFRNRAHVTVLISYGLDDLASHAELAEIATAIDSHVGDVQ